MEPSKQSIKLEPTQQTKQMCEALRNADNLSETKATLEISLKNSAELLKQLSSIGQIEQMHQLETQMRESMQLIEKLKSASGSQQMEQQQLVNSPTTTTTTTAVAAASSFFQTINTYPNKLKTVTSIPSDLKQLEAAGHEVNAHGFHPSGSSALGYNQVHFSSQVHLKNAYNIPFTNKNVIACLWRAQIWRVICRDV